VAAPARAPTTTVSAAGDAPSDFVATQPFHHVLEPGAGFHIDMLEPHIAKAATVSFASVVAATSAPAPAEAFAADARACSVHAELRRVLAQYGFAIVTDVLSAAEVKRMEQLFAQDLLSIVDVKHSPKFDTIKDDPVHSWPLGQLPLGMKFAINFGLPQGQLAWAARSHANVKEVFAAIHGTRDLCCSTDVVFFENRVDADADDAHRLTSLWPHADQNKFIHGGDFDIYQGVVYMWPATGETSATVVWPCSNNREYDALMASKDWTTNGHFCRLAPKQHPLFAQRARRVPVPAGGLLLWSSKTIHQGWPRGPRLAIPLCLEPSARRTAHARATKLKIIRAGSATTHWASLAIEHDMFRYKERLVSPDNGLVIEHKAHQHLLQSGKSVPDSIMDLV